MTTSEEDVLKWKLLVYKIAHAYWRRMNQCGDIEDYISDGFVGLIEGLQQYDETRTENKKSYLSSRISWSIIAGIKRDQMVTRHGYEEGVRILTHHIADLEEDVFAQTSRELDNLLVIVDLERLFSVMLEEEKVEFNSWLHNSPHDPRACCDARTFCRPKSGISKVMVNGFSRMQNLLHNKQALL